MKKNLRLFLFIFFAMVFAFSLFMLVRYAIDSRNSQNLHNSLAGLHTTGSTASTAPTGTAASTMPTTTAGTLPPETTVTTAPEGPVILPEMQELYAINDHLVGWIMIEDTNVNYPVVQTPNSPDWWDYYLYRDFYGQKDDHGSLYVRESCDVFAPSDNVTIYGHNMADFTMFGHLYQYGSKNFYENHKYIQFDTIYERHTYEIFAVFRTSGTDGFAYHLFDNAQDQEAYDAFVAQVLELSIYDTGIVPQYGDKLLTLSTCDFHLDDGRLVVMARRISE